MSNHSTATNSARCDHQIRGNLYPFWHNGIVFLDEVDIFTGRKPVRAAVKGRNVVRDTL